MEYSVPPAYTVRSQTAGLRTRIYAGAEASYGNSVQRVTLESETHLQK